MNLMHNLTIPISMYDAPAKNVPIANFTGRLGCLVPSFCHKSEIIGANNKINNGLIDWNTRFTKVCFKMKDQFHI